MRRNFLILALFYLFLGVKPVFASSIVLNELMPHPSTGNDWIEIYNPTDSSMDISSWILVDSTSTMKTLSGNIASKSYLTFDVSNRLNNGGDSIYLKDSSGNTIDNYSYSSDPGIDKSIGRSPDGESWTNLTSSSKGSSNGGSQPSTQSTPSPTPTPQPSTTSSSSNSTSSSFTISNIPSQINADESFKISVNLSLPDNPNTSFYIKGAFKKSDGSNYFGQTKVLGSWVKNGSSYSNQYSITTDSSGNWSGNIDLKPDEDDSGFTGTDSYIFKVGRYTQSGSGPTWSNESEVKIVATTSTSQAGSPDDPTPTTSPKLTSTATTTTPNSKTTISKSSLQTLSYKIASVAGATASATPSASPSTIEVKSQKQINFALLVGFILISCGIGLSSYIYLRSKRMK